MPNNHPKTLYPGKKSPSCSEGLHRLTFPIDQQNFDPFKADAGNGHFPNGTSLSPNADPTHAYSPWNTTLAKQWLSSLVNKPRMVAIDNEIEIASSTHQDMHPEYALNVQIQYKAYNFSSPIDYDEELDRVVRFATAAKEALPDVKVVAPSTCSWWFCE